MLNIGEKRSQSGFTLIEVVVVVAVIALLAGLVVPTVMGVSDDTKASKIMAVCDALKKGVERHYLHTGTPAREYTGYTETTNHELAMTQTTAGWKGPYIDHPLSKADNPYGGVVHLYEAFSGGGGNAPTGFDLLGSGTDSATGNGQFVYFTAIPEAAALLVDAAYDNGIAGDWKVTGRVEYIVASKVLNVYLMDTK